MNLAPKQQYGRGKKYGSIYMHTNVFFFFYETSGVVEVVKRLLKRSNLSPAATSPSSNMLYCHCNRKPQ